MRAIRLAPLLAALLLPVAAAFAQTVPGPIGVRIFSPAVEATQFNRQARDGSLEVMFMPQVTNPPAQLEGGRGFIQGYRYNVDRRGPNPVNVFAPDWNANAVFTWRPGGQGVARRTLVRGDVPPVVALWLHDEHRAGRTDAIAFYRDCAGIPLEHRWVTGQGVLVRDAAAGRNTPAPACPPGAVEPPLPAVAANPDRFAQPLRRVLTDPASVRDLSLSDMFEMNFLPELSAGPLGMMMNPNARVVPAIAFCAELNSRHEGGGMTGLRRLLVIIDAAEGMVHTRDGSAAALHCERVPLRLAPAVQAFVRR